MLSTSLMMLTPPPKQDKKPLPTEKEAIDSVVKEINTTVEDLNEIWDGALLDSNSRRHRIDYAFSHIKSLLKDIITSEGEMIKQVSMDIESHRKNVAAIRQLLSMDPLDESEHRQGSVPLLKALESELKTLESTKAARMKKQETLYKSLQKLCRRANADVDEALFEGINERIFSEDELQNLRQINSELYDILAERLERVTELQAESKKICKTIGSVCCLPTDDQEFLETDFSSPATVLSADVLQRSEVLNQKLKEEHDTWMETVVGRYEELLKKMNEISKRCCRGEVPIHQGESVVQSEEKLLKLEEEYEKMKEKYERGAPVFDKLNEWMAIWKERLDSEQRACRTSFYNNRGGSLNNTLKRQRILQTQIPKVFNELCQLTTDYVSKYGPEDIMVDGFRPDKYAQAIIEEYERDKELARVQRIEKRNAGKSNGKVAFGSSTPSLKHEHTPKPKPLGLGGTLPKTPSTATLERKRSVECAKISVIPPVRPPTEGPVMSSPKPMKKGTPSTKKVPPPPPPGEQKASRGSAGKALPPPPSSRGLWQ